jgi:hypothetical protein
VAYDLLDPSAFSVSEAKAQLGGPFVPGAELVMTLQDLPAAAERFVHALRPGGLGLVAQATGRSHHLAFYGAFRAGVQDATPYTSSEQVRDALTGAGAQVREQLITYRTGTADRAVAEGFLQRCAFDDSVSLEQMEAAPVLGDYLAGCRDATGAYAFDHEVALLWL